MKALPILFFVVLIFLSCNSSDKITDKQSTVQTPIKLDTIPQKYLTIVFLDVSGSFNKIQKKGGFSGKNYFDESCNELTSVALFY